MVRANESRATLLFNPGLGTLGLGAAKMGCNGHNHTYKHDYVGDGRASFIVKSALGKRLHRSVHENKNSEQNVIRKKKCTRDEFHRIGQEIGLNGGKASTDPGAIGQLTGTTGVARQDQ